MSYKSAAKFDVLRTVAFGTITTSFVQLGPPLPTPAVAVAFKNDTDAIVQVSTDGVNAMLIYPAMSYGVYDIGTNSPSMVSFLLAEGTCFYVQYTGTAPSTGSFSIEAVITQV